MRTSYFHRMEAELLRQTVDTYAASLTFRHG